MLIVGLTENRHNNHQRHAHVVDWTILPDEKYDSLNNDGRNNIWVSFI